MATDPLFSDVATSRRVDFHSFRRAFNTALAEAGVNVQTAMHLAGHSDAKTHMRYVQSTAAMRRIPIAALPQLNADSPVETSEPRTIRRQSSRIGARYTATFPSVPGAIRTRDLPLRRRMLYPTELRGPAATLTRLPAPHQGDARGGKPMSRAVLTLVRGNIVDEDVDAVVNAANESLLGGGGVDGAIHRAAGPELLAHCRTLGGCPTGAARLTPGFRLRARWVIHTVGPVYGVPRDAKLLVSAYASSLAIAEEQGFASVSFPSISTGAYGYPLEEAAPLALGAVVEQLERAPRHVRFVLFGADALDAYTRAWDALGRPFAEAL
jgi:O-acetyl-ADP-ribose deacetylase (regulator of RNase III)